MAVTLDRRQVWQALRPRLGSGLAAEVCDEVLAVLESYTPRQTDLSALHRQVEDTLFSALYRLLGVRMCFVRSNGAVDRIRTDELGDLADCAMGVLLGSLRPTPANFDLIKVYAMQSGSLSALNLLKTAYADRQSDAELAILDRILAEQRG